MDNTWRLKFSSTWTLPMPEILPSPLTPAIVPAMSASSSANQMNTTNRQCTFPFATQGYNAENHATSLEPPIFPTLHLSVTDPGKTELNNSSLATTLHNLPDGISPLVKLHRHNGGTIVSNSCYAPQITSIYPLNKSANDSMLNPRVHSLDESRFSLLYKSSKSPNFLSDLKFSPPNDVNNNQYHPSGSQMNTSRISQTVTAKTATVVPNHESIHYRGCPRVICVGTVGELFLSELGILGVTCYCHNITMSVAKFCEHAGSSANVGQAVHLESGMTIAQWRKLCFGNTAPDDGKGWDWPANSSTESCSVKYRVNLPLHPHTVGHVKTFSGLANSLEEEYQTNNLVNACYDSKGSYGIQSLFYPHPNSKSSISRNNFPSEGHKVSVNGHSSNIDLRLGQPPQVHTYAVSSSTAMNPMQCKPEANHPSKEKFLAANCPLETKDPISGLSYGSHISFTRERCESQYAIMGDGNADKGLPSSSLFQDSKSKMNNESHYLSFINSKCSTVDSSSNSLGGIFSCKTDKRKRPRCFENGIHDKQNTDIKAPRQSLGVQIVRSDNSTPDRSQLYMNFNQKLNMPVNYVTYNNPVNLISFNSGKPTIPTSTNSMHHSKTAFKSTHEHGINHEEKLFDDSMEHLKSQKTCFHSGINLQKDFCNGGSEAMDSSRQWSCHDIKQINGSTQASSKYLCQNELGRQAVLTEDSSICSKEQESFSCHACYVKDHPCLRLGKQIFDQKEQGYKKPFYGNCCSVLAKHLTSCCLYKDFISSSSSLNRQILCGGAKIGHFPQIRNEIHKFHDPKCENKKQKFTSGQPGLWRDVPAKKTDATSLKSSIGKVDKTAHDSDSKMEDQMSNICTGSPAPALTEVSVEVNRETFCSHDSYKRKSYEFVVDEESVVEKCGSSDEAAISECEKTNAVVSNQDNNMKSKDEEQMETISWPMNSEPSHRVGHMNLKLFEHDQHTCPVQADNVKQSSVLKRKEISCSLTEVSKTSNKLQVIKKDLLLGTLAVPSEKNKQNTVQETVESNDLDFRKPYKYISLNFSTEDDTNVKVIDKEYVGTEGKPVVCGEYGGLSGQKKPAKIVSLSSILKRTKKIYTNEYGLLSKKTFSSKARKMSMKNNNVHNAASLNDLKNDTVSQNETICGINGEENSIHHDCKEYQTRAGYKEVCSCSLSKLLATDHHTTLGNVSIDGKNSGKRYQNSDAHDGEPTQTGTESRSGEMNFDTSCCVCGKANREEISVMLECHRCLIKVHQACYGVSEVPLGNWHCRPCKINSQSTGLLQRDIVKNPKPKCARTLGFNGLKSGEAFNHSFLRIAYNAEKRCIVSQKQINAWDHINSLTSCRKTPLKRSSPDIDYDTRGSYNNNRYSKKLDTNSIHLNLTQKEYFRYKQSKAWKKLVVYKSGIHSYGLYSSELINRGTMVVEYVGEIIGQKVADKREKEYELSNGLQYKSACYFFRIDKDNIIDATRKGGIARFVNHSCQPNCVAKIITVQSEKKVVFFATRDINPGEEITYDYHFNSEDEGEKIPCYCNSKNCRRYLN